MISRASSHEQQKHLRVYLTIDVGPTDAILGSGHIKMPSWDTTFKGLDTLQNLIPLFEQRTQCNLPATWFVRADRYIEHQFGSSVAILEQFMDKMTTLTSNDHEIAWMPQLPAENTNEVYYDDLLTTHHKFKQTLPQLESVRMGDCYHDNTSMQILNQLGIRFDSSALPGRIKNDSGWCMDWQNTPQLVYHPSYDDYRVPGHPKMDILEIPLSVAPILAPYDSKPLLRYLNPCTLSSVWNAGLDQLIATAPYIVCILHPDELISRTTQGHPLVSYSTDVFLNNLINLVNKANISGRTVSFCTIRHFNQTNKTQLALS